MELHLLLVRAFPLRKLIALMGATEVDISLSIERTSGWRRWYVGSFGYSFDIDRVVVGEVD